MRIPSTPGGRTTIIYDGECPFCSRYVEYARLRAALPGLKIVNARDVPEEVAGLQDLGFNLDDGMIVIHEGEYFFGADAMTFLARHGAISALRHVRLARALYPAFRWVRNVTLRTLGKTTLR